ncbi:DNA topoisomerase-3 [Tissierella praeacuta DSM 18095]|uniref:DNA topoisomerase 3 n=1 Tax=Tissierella praeacuta DSM 18095 TaxID=1123404 RepID=A0A1M4UYA1_9FIRM|nr:DNA topoisomerase III [Tissierella praeacuta]TCU73987.1 DNA topoisomerase-3 [Tissierella praeacuta]SHE61731.1 DNA topoisomerase-3 [Tissierella praeacuta DSM 18095]SUP02700.1 DNA topoisomerase 3 [Tissierella praeacuta]
MNKILVLAEKPSVGRDIARVLNCKKKGNGYLEGDKYIVTWALGHLVTLADPEQYNKKYKTWNMEDLPMLPEKMRIEVIRQSSKQFYSVKEQMHRKDVKEIIIATDAGREGELVARWIIEKANVKKPIKRLWISSVTDKAIKDGFNNLKDGKYYENLYDSAVARAEADWIVGINGTRALTVKYNAQLSCGRVQTPTLSMIAQREEEIKRFVPKEYYGIAANTKELKLTWQDNNTKDIKTFDKGKSDKILESIKGKDAKVMEVEKTLKKKYSPGLYDLTELQRDANRIFGYSAKETLSIMQRLYENHKILTYPRTDSRYISDDIVGTLKDRIHACGVGQYQKIASKILLSPIKSNKSFVDNSKVTDHHAIIPTEQRVLLSELNDNERKIYDLVVKRFLAVLYAPFEYEQTTIKAKIGDENFVAKGKRVISAGWKEVYSNNYYDEDEEDNEDQSLPVINKGDTLKVISLVQTTGKTKPPAPFNEGTLLQAMENPVKYMSDESKTLKKIIGETGGIGTVATRADIIEKLFNTFLIEKNGKDIFITSKGKQLLDLVPEELKSPALTAEWEQKLGLISQGKLNKDSFIKEMKEYSKTVVKEIKNSDETFRHDNMTRNKCPECGKFMLEVKGKKGKMYVCQDRECGYRKSIAKITNARCPNCKKKLELRGEGEGQIFACSCGYREKLSTFNERKAKEKNNISKRDVASYMKQQKKAKTEPINTDLADALSKLKF